MSLVMGTVMVSAQQNIDPTVQVSRDYEATLMQITKSPIEMSVIDTLSKLDLKFDYTVFDRPFKDLYEFVPLKSIDIDHDKEILYPSSYVKLAYSYPVIPYADVIISPRLGDRFALVLDAHHRSVWNDPLSNDIMNNNVGLGLGYAFKELELVGKFRYNNGYNVLSDSLSRNYNKLDFNFGVRSTSAKNNAISYGFEIDYNYLNDNALLKEFNTDVDAFIGFAFLTYHKAELIFGTSMVNNYSLYNITPKYYVNKGRSKFIAGLDVSFDKKMSAVYPKLELSYEAVSDNLWLYLRVDGYSELNTNISVLDHTPWAYMSIDEYSVTKNVLGEFGLRGQMQSRFSYDLKAGFSNNRDVLSFYFTSLSNHLESFTYNFSRFYSDLSLAYEISSLKLEGGFRYNHFYKEDIYLMPEIKANLSVAYNYMDRFSVKVGCDYLGEMYCYDALSLNSKAAVAQSFDLQANMSYAYNEKYSFFIQGKNLLNQKRQYVAHYLEPGANFGAGITMKF